MSNVVLDTDVSSTIVRGRQTDRLQAVLAGKTPFISFVTLGELTKWGAVRDLGTRRRASLHAWERNVGVLLADEEVAVTWGLIQARAVWRGRPRPVNDAWIAACCLANDLPLATFNTKDFVDFAQHEGLRLLSLS